MITWTMEHWIVFRDKVQRAAAEAFKQVVGVASDLEPGDTGGYFTIKRRIAADKVFVHEPFEVGQVDKDKVLSFTTFCLEKADRLMNFNKSSDHLSSWQSRRLESCQYGGAVRGQTRNDYVFFFSFSGLTEHCDEAISLLVAMKFGCLSNDEAIHIANISGNTVFLRCLTEVNRKKKATYRESKRQANEYLNRLESGG